MDKQIIISIGREYGSAGHEIARKLAEKLEIPFYDRNLLDEFADQKDVDADLLAKYDEKPKRYRTLDRADDVRDTVYRSRRA